MKYFDSPSIKTHFAHFYKFTKRELLALSQQEERRSLDDLRRRQTTRLAETDRAAMLSLGAPDIIGVAAILPRPAALPAGQTPMHRDDAVEQAAMEAVARFETARGWTVSDVHEEGRGYDLLSQGPDGKVRYIEVKGRAMTGAVGFSSNEWLKAEQLGRDYWLYVVTDALTNPTVHPIRDPHHNVPEQEVVATRYRVSEAGWHHVAESGATYHTDTE